MCLQHDIPRGPQASSPDSMEPDCQCDLCGRKPSSGTGASCCSVGTCVSVGPHGWGGSSHTCGPLRAGASTVRGQGSPVLIKESGALSLQAGTWLGEVGAGRFRQPLGDRP